MKLIAYYVCLFLECRNIICIKNMVVFQFSQIFYSIFNRHCVFVCIFTTIFLILIDHIIKPSIKIKYQPCDSMRIQEHYMNNLRY